MLTMSSSVFWQSRKDMRDTINSNRKKEDYLMVDELCGCVDAVSVGQSQGTTVSFQEHKAII